MPSDQTEVPDASDARYQSYLLRLWQEAPSGEHRALVQDVMSGDSHWFSSLESLLAFLRAQGEEWHNQERLEEGLDP